MTRSLTITIGLCLFLSLTGCATNNIGTPCPNFGASCAKTPINSWNNQN